MVAHVELNFEDGLKEHLMQPSQETTHYLNLSKRLSCRRPRRVQAALNELDGRLWQRFDHAFPGYL